jgi:hypothetical protein
MHSQNYPLCLMNVITFIIMVLKLLFMQGKYILFAFVVILLVCSPVMATTKKVAAGAPVFIGEINIDITSAIKDCHVIEWWPDETSMSGPAVKNITVKNLNAGNGLINRFNVTPQVFDGYTGNWYCEDIKPPFLVLTVVEPQLSIRAWDIDNDTDVTGQSVPFSANVTYRIDTNLNQALSYYNRTSLTPADSFFTVRLTDPWGQQIPNIYTGSIGAASTQILPFDSNPYITTPSYFGKNMGNWNHLSRYPTGDLIYHAGTYTFTVYQDLDNMTQLYNMTQSYASAGPGGLSGKTTASASVTFLPQFPLTPTPTPGQENAINPSVTPQPEVTELQSAVPTTAPVAGKTTYSPLPAWIVITGTGGAALLFARKRQ